MSDAAIALGAVEPTVVRCYATLSLAELITSQPDFTEGRYLNPPQGHDRAAYEAAQQAQAAYLLDEVHCRGAGSSLLDIGCGYGRILQAARARGARAVGITIAPPQVAYGRRAGLTVEHLSYRDLGTKWSGRFTCAIANGSLEHFAQVRDAVSGRLDAVYQELFTIVRRVLRGPGCRFITTAIHFRHEGQVKPERLVRGPAWLPRGGAEYHFAMVLGRVFGGWYPEPGQLQCCAQGSFQLVREEEGTTDYHYTSEYWLQELRRNLRRNPALWWGLLRRYCKDFEATSAMIRCLLVDQSWMWQFRGDPAPTRLLRQTWDAV
jgi:cyclopropane fatty-acyl-phospholipid synthase-like methyltransferase